MYATQAEQVVQPQTTGELFKYIAKRLPKQILKTLPITIAVAVVSWLVHTFLIVGPNGGFSPDTWLANNVLNVTGKFISSTMLWAMLGGIITMMISSLIQGRNPFKTFAEMFKVPGNIIKKNKEMKNALLPVLLIAAGVTLLFEKLLSGVAGIVAGGIMLSSVAALMMGTGGIFAMIFRMIFNDIQAFVLKKRNSNMDNEAVYMILGASGMTFMLFGFLQATNLIGWIFSLPGRIVPFLGVIFFFIANVISVILSWAWAILLLIGIILYATKHSTSSATKTMIFFSLFCVSIAAAQKLLGINIFADDGGWAEAGGTFSSWVGSEGAFQAVASGLPPAIGGVIGANIAGIFGGIGGGLGGGIGGAIGGAGGAGFVPPDGGGIGDVGQGFGPGEGTDTGAGTGEDTGTGQEENPPQEQTPEEKAKAAEEERKQREQYEKEQRAKAEEERRRAEEEHKKEMERRRQEYEQAQKEKAEQERIRAEQEKIRQQEEERQKYIDKLCKKYNTTPDKLRDKLRQNIAEGQAEAEKWNKVEKVLWVGEKMATATVVVADTMIDGMASVGGPGAKAIRAGYKVVKGAASSAAEKGLTTENIVGGAVSGGADAATDFISNPYAKAATTIVGETAAGAITGGMDGAKDGLVNGVFNAGVNAGVDKIAGNGFGNETQIQYNSGGKTKLSIKTQSGWVDKTVSDSVADKFITNKLTNQLKTSSIKGATGMTNELGVKPALKDNGILP